MKTETSSTAFQKAREIYFVLTHFHQSHLLCEATSTQNKDMQKSQALRDADFNWKAFLFLYFFGAVVDEKEKLPDIHEYVRSREGLETQEICRIATLNQDE